MSPRTRQPIGPRPRGGPVSALYRGLVERVDGSISESARIALVVVGSLVFVAGGIWMLTAATTESDRRVAIACIVFFGFGLVGFLLRLIAIQPAAGWSTGIGTITVIVTVALLVPRGGSGTETPSSFMTAWRDQGGERAAWLMDSRSPEPARDVVRNLRLSSFNNPSSLVDGSIVLFATGEEVPTRIYWVTAVADMGGGFVPVGITLNVAKDTGKVLSVMPDL